MINKTKILLTVPGLGGGGMERAALNFAVSLQKTGCKVKIFTISHNDVFYKIPKNIDVINGKKRREDVHLIPLSLYKLRRVAKKFKPKVVLSFSGKMSPYVIISLLGLKIPVIPFHRSNPHITYGRFNNALSHYFYPKCKALAVQTKKAKEIFEKKYNNKNIIVVPNPIRELNINTDTKKRNIIINVSRLVKGKGIDNLIRIFSSLNDSDWILYIIGDGNMRNSLEELADDLNVSDKVKFFGHQKNVDYHLSKASIFAFTSESEGYPNSLLEAMCAGLACISFDCPTGPSDMIIDGENGFLIDLGDYDEYRIKLEKLIKNENLRGNFGKEARKLNDKNAPDRIIENFVVEELKLSINGNFIVHKNKDHD